MQGLLNDLSVQLFPETKRQAVAAAQSGADSAQIGAMQTGVVLERAKDVKDAAGLELANMNARLAIESAQLDRIKNDPTQLKVVLGQKLVEYGVPYSPDEDAASMFDKWKNAVSEQQKMLIRLTEIKHATPNDLPKQEEALRKEYNALPTKQRHDIVADNVNKIRATAGRPADQVTAADDIATVFSYMRALDPGSTVREGEFDTARKAAGLDTRLIGWIDRVASGKLLRPEQRAEIVETAGNLLKASSDNLNKTRKHYEGISSRLGLNTVNVLETPEAEVVTETATAPAKPAAPFGKRVRVVHKDGTAWYGVWFRDPQTGALMFDAQEPAR